MPHHSYIVREGRNNFIPYLLYCGYSSLTLNPNLIEGSPKEMATHSSVLAWRIPWTEKSGRLQTMGLHRVGHD